MAEIAPRDESQQTWRERLLDAIEASGRSDRGICLRAGLSQAYLDKILRRGHDPTVTKLAAICAVLGVSIDDCAKCLPCGNLAEPFLPFLGACLWLGFAGIRANQNGAELVPPWAFSQVLLWVQ